MCGFYIRSSWIWVHPKFNRVSLGKREKKTRRYKEDICVKTDVLLCKPRNARSHWMRQWSILPYSLQGSVALPTLWFWTSGLQNYERIHFLMFQVTEMSSSVVAYSGSPGKLIDALTEIWEKYAEKLSEQTVSGVSVFFQRGCGKLELKMMMYHVFILEKNTKTKTKNLGTSIHYFNSLSYINAFFPIRKAKHQPEHFPQNGYVIKIKNRAKLFCFR